jgi:N-acyl-D-aspartate/D-glutamate deacylase
MIRCCNICLIKNAAVVDGTEVPLRHGDVGIAAGRTVEIGKIGDGAKRVIGA